MQRFRTTWLALVLIVVQTSALGCRLHYREVATSPSRVSGPPDQIALLGVRAEATGLLDPAASARLAGASGIAFADADVAPELLDVLLGDPALLLVARSSLGELRALLDRRYALIGDVMACPVEERSRWEVMVPPIWTPIGLIFFLRTFPISYARRREVPHAAVVLRLVDLDSGRVESEFLAVSNFPPGEVGLSENIAKDGLQALGLRGTR